MLGSYGNRETLYSLVPIDNQNGRILYPTGLAPVKESPKPYSLSGGGFTPLLLPPQKGQLPQGFGLWEGGSYTAPFPNSYYEITKREKRLTRGRGEEVLVPPPLPLHT